MVEKIKPDIILWTGDNPAHNIWQDTRDEIKNITKTFVDYLTKKSNNTISVYPAVGNHEEYPNDQFNFKNFTQESSFLHEIGDIYRPLISEDIYQSFIKKGYYSVLHKNTNLRIISLNCFLCDSTNYYLFQNPTDPFDQVS